MEPHAKFRVIEANGIDDEIENIEAFLEKARVQRSDRIESWVWGEMTHFPCSPGEWLFNAPVRGWRSCLLCQLWLGGCLWSLAASLRLHLLPAALLLGQAKCKAKSLCLHSPSLSLFFRSSRMARLSFAPRLRTGNSLSSQTGPFPPVQLPLSALFQPVGGPAYTGWPYWLAVGTEQQAA